MRATRWNHHCLPHTLPLSLFRSLFVSLCELNNIIWLHNNHIGGQLSQRYYKCKTETSIKNLYCPAELMFPTGTTTYTHTHQHTHNSTHPVEIPKWPISLPKPDKLCDRQLPNVSKVQSHAPTISDNWPGSPLSRPLSPFPPPFFTVCRKRVRLRNINRDAHELFQRKNEWMFYLRIAYTPRVQERELDWSPLACLAMN